MKKAPPPTTHPIPPPPSSPNLEVKMRTFYLTVKIWWQKQKNWYILWYCYHDYWVSTFSFLGGVGGRRVCVCCNVLLWYESCWRSHRNVSSWLAHKNDHPSISVFADGLFYAFWLKHSVFANGLFYAFWLKHFLTLMKLPFGACWYFVCISVLAVVSCSLYWQSCHAVCTDTHVMLFVLTVMSCCLYWQSCHAVCIGSHVMRFVSAVKSCGLYRQSSHAVCIGSHVMRFVLAVMSCCQCVWLSVFRYVYVRFVVMWGGVCVTMV